ncbi:hypothetical protein [Natrinema versiforme]|uniref:Uncharacterized protein n=1 Tax=Natrinema versiforme JCM 10478 TaxID=1227496 RepID=L9YDB1_9EURY|nr:hypothetical protein [Natrinema versiforme]ELY70908.1 hypothetical protein C489_01081 [Natrinema versiforme JCM 10478]
MIREDTREMYELIEERKWNGDSDWVSKEALHDILEDRGWGEYRIMDAENQMFEEMLVEESPESTHLRTIGSLPEE